MPRRRAIAATAVALGLIAPSSGAAQSPADSAALVQAVADVISDSLLPALRRGGTIPLHDNRGDPIFLLEPTSEFDAWVTLRLEQEEGLTFLSDQRDTAQWVVTRGTLIQGDSAAVMVEVGTMRRPGMIHTYVELSRYRFARTPAGWRFVGREFVSGADRGEVRGMRGGRSTPRIDSRDEPALSSRG